MLISIKIKVIHTITLYTRYIILYSKYKNEHRHVYIIADIKN